MSSRLPFEKALIYTVVAKAKIDGDKFCELSERYFRGITFEDPPISYVLERLSTLVIPKGILLGRFDQRHLTQFLRKMELIDLHERFSTPQFENLLFSPDIRIKLDIMSMVGFRFYEILAEARFIDDELTEDDVRVYLDAFADFSGMNYNAKRNYICQCIDSTVDSVLYNKCLDNRSYDYIRTILCLRQRSLDPLEMVQRVANMNNIKMTDYFINNNDTALQGSLSLTLKIAEMMQKLGVGNKNAAEELARILNSKDDREPLAIPSAEDLERRAESSMLADS